MIAKLIKARSLQHLPKPSTSSNSDPGAEAARSHPQPPAIRLLPHASARGIPLLRKAAMGHLAQSLPGSSVVSLHRRTKPSDLPWLPFLPHPLSPLLSSHAHPLPDPGLRPLPQMASPPASSMHPGLCSNLKCHIIREPSLSELATHPPSLLPALLVNFSS